MLEFSSDMCKKYVSIYRVAYKWVNTADMVVNRTKTAAEKGDVESQFLDYVTILRKPIALDTQRAVTLVEMVAVKA